MFPWKTERAGTRIRPVQGSGAGRFSASRNKGGEIRYSSAGQAKQMQYPLSMPCLDVSPVFLTPAQEMRVRAIEE